MKDLFGNEIGTPGKQPKKKVNHAAAVAHMKLLQLHGQVDGETCKNCQHFIVRAYAGRYFKCELFSTSGAPSSDWRAGWQACGKFIKEEIPQP